MFDRCEQRKLFRVIHVDDVYVLLVFDLRRRRRFRLRITFAFAAANRKTCQGKR